MDNSTAKSGRIKYYEIMRIVAIALVIFNHLPGYTLFMNTTGPMQWFYMFVSMLTRVNVPIFFMISGALLFGKEEDYSYVLKKRVTRIAALIIIFTVGLFILCALKSYVKGLYFDTSLKYLIYSLISGTMERAESYWFMYAYLGMLFFLPMLQRAAKGMKKQDFYVLIALHFLVSSLIPIINFVIGGFGGKAVALSSHFSVPLATVKAFFYPFIGYYLDQCIDAREISKKTMRRLFLASFAGIMISSLLTFLKGNATGAFTQDYVQLFDYVTALTLFIFIKRRVLNAEEHKKESTKKGFDISSLGALTFGIYLLDPFLKEIIYNPYSRVAEKVLPVFVISVLWIPVSMAAGGIITIVLKKLPFFKKAL